MKVSPCWLTIYSIKRGEISNCNFSRVYRLSDLCNTFNLIDTLASFLSIAETSQKVKTYVYVPLNLNWNDARSYCRQNYTDLPTIESSIDNANVLNAMSSYNAAWIGLYRIAWKWSDNSTGSFKNWLPGEPNNSGLNEYCVTEDNQHLWNDDDCAKAYAFLCHKGDISLLHNNIYLSNIFPFRACIPSVSVYIEMTRSKRVHHCCQDEDPN